MSRLRNAPVLKSVAIVRTGLTRSSSVRPWSKLELLIAVPQKDGRASEQGYAYLDDSRPRDSKEMWCAAPVYPGPGCPEDEDHKHPLVGWGAALKSGQLSIDTSRDLDHCSLPLADVHSRFVDLKAGIEPGLMRGRKKKAGATGVVLALLLLAGSAVAQERTVVLRGRDLAQAPAPVLLTLPFCSAALAEGAPCRWMAQTPVAVPAVDVPITLYRLHGSTVAGSRAARLRLELEPNESLRSLSWKVSAAIVDGPDACAPIAAAEFDGSGAISVSCAGGAR